MKASIKLLRHQAPMLSVAAKILLKSITPNRRKIKEENLTIRKDNIRLKANIVEQYHKWLDVEDRYLANTIAPHLFPLWSYPSLYKLGKALNLPLHRVLNQGVKMIINEPLCVQSDLKINVEIFKVQNLTSKIRVNQRITTGTALTPDALIAEIYAVILKNPKDILKRPKILKALDTSKLTKITSLHIAKEDAKSYAYLSGDINPIHLSKKIAKLMGLKGSIMHGFGLFALIFENLQASGHKIREIDVRFLNPVYLDSDINLYIQEMTDEKYSIKVFNLENNLVHLSGEFKV